MKNLQITNSRFITYTDDLLTVDVLGGVDLSQVERMVCTLRITYNDYPPQRTTLDLYNDNQTDKLQRTLCDKWGLKLLEASRSLYTLTLQLEEYRLQQLRYTGKSPQQAFSPSEEDRRKAVRFLSEKNLSGSLMEQLNTIGILGEDRNALILFLALASHKSANPFSVLCLAKSGIGKSYILKSSRSVCPTVRSRSTAVYRQTPCTTSTAGILTAKPFLSKIWNGRHRCCNRWQRSRRRGGW